MQTSPQIYWHAHSVSREARENRASIPHKSRVIWFTGLSGSGKSTLANAVEKRLNEEGYRTFLLDGDNVRTGLCAGLGFSEIDRKENLRRVGEVTKLFLDAGVITLTAFISPLKEDRARVKELVGEENFLEIYCRCPLEVCESRDPKGLYRRARAGEVKEFTGISSPYEPPEAPRVAIDTSKLSVDQAVARVLQTLRQCEKTKEKEN